MRLLTSFISGLLFGTGLVLSGMTDPANIIGFLDITGQWNPRLVFVMMGAVAVSFFGFRYVAGRQVTRLGEPLQLPTNRTLDSRLISGALLFGVGWGLVGYCPGPALVSLVTLDIIPWTFVLAMLVGMALFELMQSFARPE